MWTAPSMCPCSHSTGSRTSRIVTSSGNGSVTPSTVTEGISGIASPLLQQLRHPTIGQGLAPSLARRAVLQAGVGERDLADGVAADRARLTGAAVDREV